MIGCFFCFLVVFFAFCHCCNPCFQRYSCWRCWTGSEVICNCSSEERFGLVLKMWQSDVVYWILSEARTIWSSSRARLKNGKVKMDCAQLLLRALCSTTWLSKHLIFLIIFSMRPSPLVSPITVFSLDLSHRNTKPFISLSSLLLSRAVDGRKFRKMGYIKWNMMLNYCWRYRFNAWPFPAISWAQVRLVAYIFSQEVISMLF